MSSSNVKKRHWAFVLYPESAPSDWRAQLQLSGLPCAVSPLHDRDLDPTGEPKKAHYHIILSYSGPTTFNSVKHLTDSLNQPIPQALEQIRGYYRYFCHLDNPDKFQYSEHDITTINGFNIADYIELTKQEVLEIKTSLFEMIRNLEIVEYADLLDTLIDAGLTLELDVASSNTLLFNSYIRSRRYLLTSCLETKDGSHRPGLAGDDADPLSDGGDNV